MEASKVIHAIYTDDDVLMNAVKKVYLKQKVGRIYSSTSPMKTRSQSQSNIPPIL